MNRIRINKDVVYNNKITRDITIIHISDIHFNKDISTNKLNKIKEEIFKSNPDYVLITGDTIDESSIIKDKLNIKRLLVFLTDISNKCKIIMSLGNHDIFSNSDYKFFKKLDEFKNIYVLNNSNYVDEFIYVSGFTLPNEYYYNITREESKELLIEHLKKFRKLTSNLPMFLPKISLIHSPIKLMEMEVLTILKEYDLLLSGHTHGGLVPGLFSKCLKVNQGLIAPNKQILPDIARGKVEKNVFNKKITLIINGGITKLGQRSTGILKKMNFVFNVDINKIIITNKRGRYYE